MSEKKNIIITGGSSGIGAAAAWAFLKEGAHVIIADIKDIDAEALRESWSMPSADITTIKTDVSDHNSVRSLVEKVASDHGSVDVMVNNAGVMNAKAAKTADHSLEDWDRVIGINQDGVFFGMKYALQQMLKQGHGNIVNVSSLAGVKASGNNLAYTASKYAVVGMTKSAALEYASKHIRINCVCPGYIKTDMFDTAAKEQPGLADKLLRYIPMRHYGEADNIAEAIHWLASEKSKYITGQAIILDGGLSL